MLVSAPVFATWAGQWGATIILSGREESKAALPTFRFGNSRGICPCSLEPVEEITAISVRGAALAGDHQPQKNGLDQEVPMSAYVVTGLLSSPADQGAAPLKEIDSPYLAAHRVQLDITQN